MEETKTATSEATTPVAAESKHPAVDAIRAMMVENGISYKTAASWCGYSTSTFHQRFTNGSIHVDDAITILNKLGYEVKLERSKAPEFREFGGVGPKLRCMVNKTIYDTAKSYAICHTDWRDGWQMELFKDVAGRFFVAHYTQWEGAANFISEILPDEAKLMYSKYGDGSVDDLFS